jgi:hypothetical protein
VIPFPYQAAGAGRVGPSSVVSGAYSGWNPSDKAGTVTLSASDYVATGTIASAGNVRSVKSRNSGKWYVEFVATNFASTQGMGFATASASLSTYLGGDANGWCLWGNYSADLRRYTNNAFVTHAGRTMATSEVFGMNIDLDAGRAWWSEGATVISGDPAAGTGPMATFTGGTTIFLAASPFSNNSAWRVRTDPAEHSHSPQSGFTAGWPN